MPRTVLAYWDIRGYAEPIRLLLNYVEEDYEEKFYVTGPAPDYNKDCWFNEKFDLGLDFPNLPYYIDGDLRITQSMTILQYLGRKYNLVGKTEEERIRTELLRDELLDLRGTFTELIYDKDFETLKIDYIKNLAAKLKRFECFLGDREWCAGPEIRFVDFMFYELLDQQRTLAPECLEATPKLKAYLDRFEALPTVKKYLPKSKKLDITNRMGVFKYM